MSCPVDTVDAENVSWSGSCVYWRDDGSPDTDAVMQGSDGSTRSVSYGDDDTDDCPTWSDFTCAAAPGSRLVRAYLEARKARVHAKVVTKTVSVAMAKAQATKVPKIKNNGRKGHKKLLPVPSPRPKRGGHYVTL